MQIEVFWCDSKGLLCNTAIDCSPEKGTNFTIGQALAMGWSTGQLPKDLDNDLRHGRLEVACFGEHRSLDSTLSEGDRIELLGPVLLDVKAERVARVKAARARERGPYNRSYSGVAKPSKV